MLHIFPVLCIPNRKPHNLLHRILPLDETDVKLEKLKKLEARLRSQSFLPSFTENAMNNNKSFKSIWDRKIYEIEKNQDFFNDIEKNDEIDSTKNEECDCVMCASVGLKKSCN